MSHKDIIKEQEKLLKRKLSVALFSLVFTILGVSLVFASFTQEDYITITDSVTGEQYRMKKSEFEKTRRNRAFRENDKKQRRYQEMRYVRDRYENRRVDMEKLPPELRRHIQDQISYRRNF